MSGRKKRPKKAPPKRDRALEEIYAQIPNIPGCTGSCAEACGPIFMFEREFEQMSRAHGRTPRIPAGGFRCPALSPNGWCTVYTFRPFICRLWGTTKDLACPKGCEPDRWLSEREVKELFDKLLEVAGPGVKGTNGNEIDDLWAAMALEARRERRTMIERIEEVARARRSET